MPNWQSDRPIEEPVEPVEPTTAEQRNEQVTQLARQLTRQSVTAQSLHRAMTSESSANVVDSGLFEYEKGSDLDPYSPTFDARKWTKSLAQLNRKTLPVRTAGMSYRNMSVHGFGSDAGECSSCFSTNHHTVSILPRSHFPRPVNDTPSSHPIGSGDPADSLGYQRTVSNLPLSFFSETKAHLTGSERRVQILNSLDGYLESGEMLVVLGPPGR
jgi:ATP-binding cassette subfamily G (WHITE) protein 2 (PDR)